MIKKVKPGDFITRVDDARQALVTLVVGRYAYPIKDYTEEKVVILEKGQIRSFSVLEYWYENLIRTDNQ